MKNANKINRLLAAVIAPVLSCAMASCEKVIDFKEDDISRFEGITLNALISRDTVLMAAVSKAFSFTEVPPLDYDSFYDYDKIIESPQNPHSFYFHTAVLPEAEVKATVNGTREVVLKYDPSSYRYLSDYRPSTGDRIAFRADAEGLRSVSAETVIPEPGKIEILDYEKYLNKYTVPLEGIDEVYYVERTDTIIRITLRITDPEKEKNYYRLKVKSVSTDHSNPISHLGLPGHNYYQTSDTFTSSDVIFRDSRLEKPYGSWPAYFSNVFSDQLFNGKEYTFTVENKLPHGDGREPTYVIIELQSLTRDLYDYLTSVMQYRITEVDDYSEAMRIHSNVENGFGIVGGLGTEKHIIYPQ